MMQVKVSRLKKRRDFVRIQRNGLKVRGRFLVVMSRPKFAKSEAGQFGIVAPKALGKAHDRNFIKRRLRHIISLNTQMLSSHDVVVLATAQSLSASFDDLTNDMVRACTQIKTAPARKGSKSHVHR